MHPPLVHAASKGAHLLTNRTQLRALPFLALTRPTGLGPLLTSSRELKRELASILLSGCVASQVGMSWASALLLAEVLTMFIA